MTHDIDAIYDHGVFRPLEPLILPDGTRVHLRVEEQARDGSNQPTVARIHSPRLAQPEQAADFRMEVREVPMIVDWLLACPEKGFFRPIPSVD